MRFVIGVLLLAALPLAAADLVVRKPGASAPYRLEFVFARIDSAAGGVIYGRRVGWPLYDDSTGAYTGRDTVDVALRINWGVADTLRGVPVSLDSIQVQARTLLVAGALRPLDYAVDSAAAAEDSVWRANR